MFESSKKAKADSSSSIDPSTYDLKVFKKTGCWVKFIDPIAEAKQLTEKTRNLFQFIKSGVSITLPNIKKLQDYFGIIISGTESYPLEYEAFLGKTTDDTDDAVLSKISEDIDSMRKELSKNKKSEAEHHWGIETTINYRPENIIGLLIDPNWRGGVYRALAFRTALELPMHLYAYDSTKGECCYQSSARLCKELSIKQDSENFTRQVNEYYKVFQELRNSSAETLNLKP